MKPVYKLGDLARTLFSTVGSQFTFFIVLYAAYTNVSQTLIFRRNFQMNDAFILCTFSYAYLRFVFMTIGVKTESFKVTLESLFELLSSF
jgi:hypothetical protein